MRKGLKIIKFLVMFLQLEQKYKLITQNANSHRLAMVTFQHKLDSMQTFSKHNLNSSELLPTQITGKQPLTTI